MADLTTLTAELAGMKQKMVDRLVAQGDETIQPDDTMQTIVDHFDNLRTKIVNQDKEITANGEYTADEGYTGLGKVTVDVKAEPVPKYGATVDAFLGDINENGVLQTPSKVFDLVFDGVKEIPAELFNSKFRSSNVQNVDMKDLVKVGLNGLKDCFRDCGQLVSADLSKLETVSESGLKSTFSGSSIKHLQLDNLNLKNNTASYALEGMFNKCKQLETVVMNNLTELSGFYAFRIVFESCDKLSQTGLSNLVKITGYSVAGSTYYACKSIKRTSLNKLISISGTEACNYMFYSCSNLIDTGLSSLEEISGSSATSYMFCYCTSLESAYFPSLTTVVTNGMNYMFNYCSALTEIHFRADAQSVIEGLTGYSSKFGATNATIYFDLIGTITVNGVAYARNEPNSIYVEYDKTYVAWADENGNIVYTTAGAEPAVGTVVYSDEGTTQVGTVSAVA